MTFKINKIRTSIMRSVGRALLIKKKFFIQNYECDYNCCSEKPLTWIEQYSKNKNYRHYIYFQRYLVVLEERENYFLLVSGFYVEEDYYHVGLIKRYKKAENAIKK